MKLFRKLVSIAVGAAILTSSVAFSISAGAADIDSGSAVASEPNLQEKAEDGVILHAFNWSYNSIRENLPQIAAAGYSTVQTSPVTQPKDYGTSSDVAGQWWKLYQPVSLSVAESSWLGTKDELTALCEEAEKYGIKIIVDIVANHMANYVEASGSENPNKLSDEVNTYEPEIYSDYDAYFHSEKYGATDSSPTSVTRGHVTNCPDLNSANEFVQSKLYGLLAECIDCGVDGFRFDAAKHIETEDDPSVGSDFWVNTLDKAKVYYKEKTGKDLFAYGEILNTVGTGRKVTGYTKRMRVTDNTTGNNILSGVVKGNTKMASTATYSVSGGADKAVLWAESHDTYEDKDERSSTAFIDDSKIVKAWAIVAAKKDATALYLARPGSAKMGEASTDLTYKSNVVSEVNKFHNAFANVKKEKTGSSGSFVYVARGNSGIVITNVVGDAADVSLEGTGLAQGEYTDTVTGCKFTVNASGVLSGSIGDTGVAVVYKSTATPRVIASVESGSFTTDTMTVQLTLENAVSGTYALEDSTPTAFTGSPTIRIGSDYEVGETITLNLTATDADGNTASSTYLYTKKPSTASGVYIFLNPERKKNWTNINCFVYDETTVAGSTFSNGGWPGQEMQFDEASGMYYIEVPAVSVTSSLNLADSPNTYVIFNAITTKGAATQYPAAKAREEEKFKLQGKSHIFALTGPVSWEVTDLTPAPVVVEATDVTKTPSDTEPSSEPQPVQLGIYGDANLDGVITVSDVSMIQREVAEFEPRMTGLAYDLSDVDGDGSVTVKDVTYIQIFLAEYSTGYAHTNEPYYGNNSTAVKENIDFFPERSVYCSANRAVKNESSGFMPAASNGKTASVGAQTGIRGDANMDGVVDVKDVTAVQREVSEFEPRLEGFAKTLADVDKDGSITVKDITALQIYLAEFESGYGNAGEPVSLEPFTVTAKSNFFPENTASFDSDAEYITVTYSINCDKDLLGTDWLLTYDGTALQPYGSDFMPFVSGLAFNTAPHSVDYGVSGNYSCLTLSPLKMSGKDAVPFVSVTFKVLDAMNTTVELTVKDLVVSKLNSGETTSHKVNETDLVEDGQTKTPDAAYKLITSVYSGSFDEDYSDPDDPTIVYEPEVPTTAPTQPSTAPTTAPTQPTTQPTTVSQKVVYLNAYWTSYGNMEDFWIWTWNTSSDGVWIKGTGEPSLVTFTGDIKNNLLFARVQKGSAPVWGSTVWNQTSDQVTRLGGTFVTTGYSDEIMLGSWQ